MVRPANGAAVDDDAGGKSDDEGITVDTGTESVPGTSGGSNGIIDIMCALNQDVSSAPATAAAAAPAPAPVLPQTPPTTAAAAGNHPVGTPVVPRSSATPATSSHVLHDGNTSAAAAAAAAVAAAAATAAGASSVLLPRGLGTLAAVPTGNNTADTTSNGDGTTHGKAVSSSFMTLIPDPSCAGGGGGAEITGVKASLPKRTRLMRLDDGNLVVLPTNIYKQAGGVKLDLSLGGLRLNDNRCTAKNRAYNFGVLPGFSRENILALRAFRDLVIPPDRSNAKTIHLLTAAEALYRYDEEHLRPPPELEPTLPREGSAGWIPDSHDVRVAVAGTDVEITVKAGDLRAVDRPLECKRVLESLRADPTVLAGKLDLAPDTEQDGVNGVSADAVGMEPGSTGFCRVPHVGVDPPACTPFKRSLGASSTASSPAAPGGLGVGTGGTEVPAQADSDCLTKRRKRRKKSVVAEDSVSYELPRYVQNVEVQHSRSTLRLKMPLNGFLVNGDEVSVSDLVVATGLDVTRKNLLALRLAETSCCALFLFLACRDAMAANFAGPPIVKRVVAAEIFHVWYKKKSGATDSNEAADNTETDSSAPTPAANATVEPNTAKESSDTDSDRDGATGGSPKGTRDPTGSTGVVETQGAGASPAKDVDVGGGDVAGESSHSNHTAAASSSAAGPAATPSSVVPAVDDSTIITLAGPAASLGAPRIEVRMTAGDLRKTRTSRLYHFKQLLLAMMNDPRVQADKLEVAQASPTPALTMQNSSGAAAAAAAAVSAQAMAARALEDTTRAMALLASGRERDGGGQVSFSASTGLLVGPGPSNGRGGGSIYGIGSDAGLTSQHDQQQQHRTARRYAESWDPLLGGARASKRSRDGVDVSGGDGGGGKRACLGAAAGGGGEAEDSACAGQQEGLLLLPSRVDEPASKRRRQLWMLAIQENELRYERRKEEARQEYEARQSELLRWMVDEEAGRHNDWEGDAGAPPAAGTSSAAGSLFAL